MSESKPEEKLVFSENPGDQNIIVNKPSPLKYIIFLIVILLVVSGIATLIILISNNNEPSSPNNKGKPEDKEKETPISNSTTKFNNDYKIISYYPNWYGDYTDKVDWEKLTHIIYAFGFPSFEGDGSMQPLKEFAYVINPMIETAKSHGVVPVMSVGGWWVYGIMCADLFANNTDTEPKINSFAASIVNESLFYGFQGIDICWEYPTEETMEAFSKLMLKLRDLCNKNNLTLSVAVSGSSGTGYTNEVLKKLDFINIMAYDAENGPGHSPFEYAQSSFELWRDLMGVPANKLVIGVPFYARPGEIPFTDLISANEENSQKDECVYNGVTVYYNGIPTMKKKAEYAAKNEAGGIMYWEASQDSTRKGFSLLETIYDVTVENVGLANKK